MPVVPGKPGSIRYRGRLRAQIVVCLRKCQEILAYDAKQKALANPPNPPVLSVLNLASTNAMITACNAMLAAKN